jgi:hypothetical protein
LYQGLADVRHVRRSKVEIGDVQDSEHGGILPCQRAAARPSRGDRTRQSRRYCRTGRMNRSRRSLVLREETTF